jgi:septal ring factor EnvC (AmiA/AmiB activator)
VSVGLVTVGAGPKCINLDLNQVALDYHQSEMSDSQMELKRQLELLRDIWALFENAKEAAKAWEETEKEERRKAKRKREENDTNTYSLTTKRTTRSQSHSANGGHALPWPPLQVRTAHGSQWL